MRRVVVRKVRAVLRRWFPRPGKNPLLRRWDRLEAATLLTLVVLVLLVTPLVGLLGKTMYARQEAEVAEQSTRRETIATLLADAPPVVEGVRGTTAGGTALVPAEWSSPGGAVRTGPVVATNGLKAGATVPIWLDDSGSPVGKPITTDIAVMTGISVAVLVWSGVIAAAAVVFRLVRWVLDRRRYAQWDSEWERIDSKRSR